MVSVSPSHGPNGGLVSAVIQGGFVNVVTQLMLRMSS